MIEPFQRRQDRQVITKAGKFYLFDVGVAGAITQRRIPQERGEQFGKAFEHFILMEIIAHRAFKELDDDINFWRTKSGLEVDFVLGRGEVAVEIKGASRIDKSDLHPIKAFLQEYRPAGAFAVCNESRSRVHEGIHILPWREFLQMLWNDAVIS
jgi:predicted AAA+ superfamily ATPase